MTDDPRNNLRYNVTATRPKNENSLWLEITYRDGEILRAILPSLSLLKIFPNKGIDVLVQQDPSAERMQLAVGIPGFLVKSIVVLGALGGYDAIKRSKNAMKRAQA